MASLSDFLVDVIIVSLEEHDFQYVMIPSDIELVEAFAADNELFVLELKNIGSYGIYAMYSGEPFTFLGLAIPEHEQDTLDAWESYPKITIEAQISTPKLIEDLASKIKAMQDEHTE